MNPELAELLADGGAVSRRTHPHLANPIRHAMAHGDIVPLLSGTYARQPTFESVAHALQLWDPHAVLTGATAARLSWWRDLQFNRVTAISRRRNIRDVPLLQLTRGLAPSELVFEKNGFRLAHPAWSVLELTDVMGGKAIDEALRRRAVPLRALWWALERLPNRPGNQARRRLLIDSRAEPWSALERAAHQMLFEAGIEGWTTNEKLVLPNGQVRFLDICFKAARFGIELDGEAYHRTPEAFHSDRSADMWAARMGWQVVRLTHATLDELIPTVQECVRRARVA